jgi:hypothetical protein
MNWNHIARHDIRLGGNPSSWMAALADQPSLPWPDEFPRKIERAEIGGMTDRSRSGH